MSVIAPIFRTSAEQGISALRQECGKAAKATSAERFDVLLSAIAQLGAAMPERSVAQAILHEIRNVGDLVELTVGPEAWQTRTYWVARAQLLHCAEHFVEAARAWLHVAQVAPHRESEAMANARGLFIRAKAFDEWIERTGSPMPPLDARRVAAKSALDSRIFDVAVPELDLFFVASRDAHTLVFHGVDWERLQRLVEADVAPNALEFLEEFAPEYVDEPLFGGRLVLPPAQAPGFYVETVDAPLQNHVGPLLARAKSVVREDGRLLASWVASAAKRPSSRDTTGLAAKHLRFVQHVQAALGPHLRASSDERWHFEGAPFHSIAALADALGAPFSTHRHHRAPAPKSLLKATAGSAAKTTFDGFVVWPPNKNYGVSLVGVTTKATGLPAAWSKSADQVLHEGTRRFLYWA